MPLVLDSTKELMMIYRLNISFQGPSCAAGESVSPRGPLCAGQTWRAGVAPRGWMLPLLGPGLLRCGWLSGTPPRLEASLLEAPSAAALWCSEESDRTSEEMLQNPGNQKSGGVGEKEKRKYNCEEQPIHHKLLPDKNTRYNYITIRQ